MTDRSARSHVYVGAAQSKAGTLAGVFRRAAGEDRWERLTKGLPEATSVQAITVHPTNPDVVYLGTRAGAYRSLDRGERWERLAFPDDGAEVWSILVHPRDPRILYAGTSPVSVYRSDDGGDTWRATYFQDPRFPGYNVAPDWETASCGKCFSIAVCSAPERQESSTRKVKGGLLPSMLLSSAKVDCPAAEA